MGSVMESNLIEVQMGKMELAQSPDRLITRGLGSCLGITIWDPVKKLALWCILCCRIWNGLKSKTTPAVL